MEKPNYNNDLDSNSKQTHIEVYFTNLPIKQIKLCMKKYACVYIILEEGLTIALIVYNSISILLLTSINNIQINFTFNLVF